MKKELSNRNACGGGGTCLNAPVSHPEGVNPTGSSLCTKLKAGLPRLKHLTRSRLTALYSLAGLQDCSSLNSLAPRNDVNAFTLAEVLVTLGIIGVVSAMTVPSLMQNYQRQTYITQLHKVYNELQQAFMQYKNDKNALNLIEAGMTTQAETNSFLKTYFKGVTSCDTLVKPCVSNGDYKNMNGAALTNSWWANVNCSVLGSGASVCIEAFHGAVGQEVRFGHIFLDVNGLKGPNIAGRDVFVIVYFEDGTLDEEGVTPICNAQKECSVSSNAKTLRENFYNSKCKSNSEFKGCFGKILNDNWQMNY